MLLTTSIDLDWTDLPAHPGYLQLVSVLIKHLSGQSAEAHNLSFKPGERWTLPLEETKRVREVQVIPPTSEVEPTGELFSSDQGSYIQVRNADAPGFYTVWVRTVEGQEYAQKYAVNVVRPDAVAPLATQDQLAAVAHESTALLAAKQTLQVDAEIAASAGTPIWPFLLFALLILLITESYAALKI